MTGSPSLSQIDSAAALSDSVIAARIESVTVGGFSSRKAVMVSGTFEVDHAGPLGQSPKTSCFGFAPDGADDDAHRGV